MNHIEYHLATLQDIDIVVDFRIEFAIVLGGRIPEAVEQKLRELAYDYFGEELDKNYLCWYATVNGEPASVAGMVLRRNPGNIKNPSGRWGYIMNVYTRPEYRRMGLSTNIMQRLEETAVSRGITAFELHATNEGEPLYLQQGFEVHPEPTYRKFV
jgi:ribosomal protein S18 acetylase RimI-like enzyme